MRQMDSARNVQSHWKFNRISLNKRINPFFFICTFDFLLAARENQKISQMQNSSYRFNRNLIDNHLKFHWNTHSGCLLCQWFTFDAFYPLVNNLGTCKFFLFFSPKCNRWQQFRGISFAPYFNKNKTVDTTFFPQWFECFAGSFFFAFSWFLLIVGWILSQTNRRWWHRFVLSLSLAFFSPLLQSYSASFLLQFKPFAHQRCSMTTNIGYMWFFVVVVVIVDDSFDYLPIVYIFTAIFLIWTGYFTSIASYRGLLCMYDYGVKELWFQYFIICTDSEQYDSN